MSKILLFSLLSLSLGLTACSQYQDNSLLSDAKVVDCPIGCAANLKADDGQIAIKIMNNTTQVAAGETRFDVSGECYASYFPTNKITIKVLNQTESASYSVYYYGVDANPSNVICKNGRFNAVVDMSTLTAGTYIVRATLIAYDASGVEHRNETDGSSYVKVYRLGATQ